MNSKKVINILAYCSVMLVAIAMLLRFFDLRVFNWGGKLANICNQIAFWTGLIVTCSCGAVYASSKRNGGYMLAFVIAVLVIIIFAIL